MAVRHFYVSSVVGTNTGTTDTSYASAQTGAMSSLTASNVYDRLGRVAGISSPPIDGDFIYVADTHSAAYDNTGNVIFNNSGSNTGVGLIIVSVDAANIDAYKPGANDELNDVNSDDYIFERCGLVAGISLKGTDDTVRLDSGDTRWRFQDLTIYIGVGSGDIGFRMGSDGYAELINVEINTQHSGNYAFYIIAATQVSWKGGSLTGTALNDLCGITALDGALEMIGVDLSGHTGTIMPTSGGTSDHAQVTLNSCKLNSSVTLHNSINDRRHRFEMYNCDDSTGNAFHRFYVADGNGAAKNNDATYVTSTESWYEGTDKSSIEITTNSICGHARPFIFELPAQYVDLGDTASDTVSIDLLIDNTAFTLTDTDIAAFLVYPDSASVVTSNWLTTGKTVGTGNYGTDPIATGTTLTNTGGLTDASWTKSLSDANATQYRLELDTSTDAGEATAVGIRIEVYKPSIAAGELFIHPLLTTS